MDLIEEELNNIINDPESDYDEEDPFFDEDEPTPFERGYGRILAVIRAAKEGEERLYEYVRRQAEFLGIMGKRSRGQEDFSTLLFEMTRFLASLSVAYISETPPRLIFGEKPEEKKKTFDLFSAAPSVVGEGAENPTGANRRTAPRRVRVELERRVSIGFKPV